MKAPARLCSLLAAAIISGCGGYCTTYDGYNCEFSSYSSYTRSSVSVASYKRYNLKLEVAKSDCKLPVSNFSGLGLLRSSGSSYSLTIPGRVTLKGTKRGTKLSVRGNYRLPFSACNAQLSADLSNHAASSSPVSASAQVYCNQKPYCSVKAAGIARKLSR